MKRWVNRKNRAEEVAEVDNFLEAIVEVCKRHKLTLSQEDTGGYFQVEGMSNANIEWLRHAEDNRR